MKADNAPLAGSGIQDRRGRDTRSMGKSWAVAATELGGRFGGRGTCGGGGGGVGKLETQKDDEVGFGEGSIWA